MRVQRLPLCLEGNLEMLVHREDEVLLRLLLTYAAIVKDFKI